MLEKQNGKFLFEYQLSDYKYMEPYNYNRLVKLIKEWHPTKNGDLSLESLAPFSHVKVWWLGECGHEWEMGLASRNSKNSNCPYCSGHKILVGFNDLATTNPKLAAEWHPTKNGNLMPTDVSKGSDKKVWWLLKCGHEFETGVEYKSRIGCPICAGRQILVGFNDLATTNPKLAAEWHPTKNEILTIHTVTKRSDKKAWWLGKCGHEWEASISNRTIGRGCPVCANVLIISGINDLATTNPKLAAEWHPTNNHDILPNQISPNSGKKVWWLGKCGHSWLTTVASRNKGKHQCPYCAFQLVLTGFNDLKTKSPILAAEFHKLKNGNQKPETIIYGSSQKVWWECEKGHEWQTSVSARKGGTGCPNCVPKNYDSKPEREIIDFLQTNLEVSISHREKTVLKNQELDIWIEKINFAIEYNGIYWHTEEYRKNGNYHFAKYKEAKDQQIYLYQIWEDEYEKYSNFILKELKTRALLILNENLVVNKNNQINIIEPSEMEKILSIMPEVSSSNLKAYKLGSANDSPIVFITFHKGYATIVKIINGNSSFLLEDFYKHFFNENPDMKTIYGISDNCFPDDLYYTKTGFTVYMRIKPDFWYAGKKERLPRQGYNNEEGLQKIWDAGKTVYVKKKP